MLDSPTSQVPLDEVAEWRKRGTELRKRLVERRQVLMAELREIDIALADLPKEAEQPNGTRKRVTAVTIIESHGVARVPASAEMPRLDPATFRRSSIPDIVKAIVRMHPEGINSNGVVRAVREIRPNAVPANIYSALYRASPADIVSKGDSRDHTYFPAVPGEEGST